MVSSLHVFWSNSSLAFLVLWLTGKTNLLRKGTMDNFPCLLLLQCSTEWALPMPMYSMNLRQERNENTVIIPLEMQEDLDRIITEAGT